MVCSYTVHKYCEETDTLTMLLSTCQNQIKPMMKLFMYILPSHLYPPYIACVLFGILPVIMISADLGEPWCSAWGVCEDYRQSCERNSGLMEEEMDHLFVQLSQQLDSSPAHFEDTTASEVSCSSCFAPPKTDEEAVKACLQAVPKKTRH